MFGILLPPKPSEPSLLGQKLISEDRRGTFLLCSPWSATGHLPRAFFGGAGMPGNPARPVGFLGVALALGLRRDDRPALRLRPEPRAATSTRAVTLGPPPPPRALSAWAGRAPLHRRPRIGGEGCWPSPRCSHSLSGGPAGFPRQRDRGGGFVSNGFGEHSPGGLSASVRPIAGRDHHHLPVPAGGSSVSRTREPSPASPPSRSASRSR